MRAALGRLALRRTNSKQTEGGSSMFKFPPSPGPVPPPVPSNAPGLWPVQGDYVMAKLDDWTRYYGGEVKKVHKDTDSFDILFDDGERHRHVPRMCLRRPGEPAQNGSDLESSNFPPLSRFLEGDRVSCKIAGWNSWYDGYVTSVNPDMTYVVTFDDGEVVSTVREKEMMPVSVDDGGNGRLAPPPPEAKNVALPDWVKDESRLEAKCDGWHKFYMGTVQEITENRLSCTVLFDDGELREGVTASMIRPPRTKSQMKIRFDLSETVMEETNEAKGKKFKIGMRVMANPFSEWSKAYPGIIERKMNDGTYAILFDDGDRVAGVSVDDMDPIRDSNQEGPSQEDDEVEFRVGQHVEAKVGQWRKYYPGRIRSENPNGTFVIDFLDGEVVHEVKLEELRKSRQRTETTASEVTERPNSPDQVFHVGERIAAKLFIEHKWRKYWGGEVTRCNPDGSYKVTFDDGEVYSSVWAVEMKRPKPGSALAAPILKTPPPEFFDVGERVEVKTMNWKSWYPGLIEKRNDDDTYIVQFDDGERLLDIKIGEIRRLIKAKTRAASSSDEEDAD